MRYQCSASCAVALGRFPIFYLSKSRSDSRRARRFFEALIIVPAVYLALQQHPAARSIALMSLGRKRGCTLARAMEGDRDISRRNAPKGWRYSGPVRLKRINRPNRLAAQPARASEVSVHYACAGLSPLAASFLRCAPGRFLLTKPHQKCYKLQTARRIAGAAVHLQTGRLMAASGNHRGCARFARPKGRKMLTVR